jgi:nitrate/TMAO reductase-like tetraheme cytochrome c subunit
MQRFNQVLQGVRRIKPRTWFLALGGIFVLFLLFLGGLFAWDYTNSSYFCGTTCHTMPPHYESYLRSPHARVACVECHIGRTSFGVQITRKAVDAQFVWAYATGQYEFPLHAKGLQPARESCEKCHWPEKFSWDTVRQLREFTPDENNSEVTTNLVMKTGGGTERQGLGRGIHWHIENPIDFAYTDDLTQDIPWIQVTNPDGTQTVYTDIENPLTPEQLAALPTRRMDCIDCHNRVSHTFYSPDDALDLYLANNQIDPTIPEIKEKGVELLTPQYESTTAAEATIGNLEQYYQETYPEYYAQNSAVVQNAVRQLQALYPQLHHPDQGLDWTTHPDNIGHKNWPGCFRCHDGKHFTQDRKEAIRLECNVCHSIPALATAGQSAPAITLERLDEPDSHKTTTWLLEHRTKFDATCQECHDTRNAGGSDNTSFCSNGACHGTKWTFAGFDAPALAQIIQPPVKQPTDPNAPPSQIPHPIGGSPDCQICHGLNSNVRPMPDDHEGRTNDVCLACHVPTIPPEGAAAEAGTPPGIPHDLAGRTECLGCHASGAASFPQVPQSHKDQNFTNGQCTSCHQPTQAGEQAPPTPTQPEAVETPTATPQPAIPNIPPDHATSACGACHETGALGAPRFPENHAEYLDANCTDCHQRTEADQEQQETSKEDDQQKGETREEDKEEAETPEQDEEEAETSEDDKEQAETSIPNIPPDHATSACAACHATGTLGAPRFPENHAGFLDTNCTDCHKPTP